MNYNVKNHHIYLLLFIVLVFSSCKQDQKPDVSKIDLNIKIQRFDRDLYQGKSKDLAVTDQLLAKKYGQFYNDFITRMVGNPSLNSIDVLEGLYNGRAYEDLNREVDSVYPNLSGIEKDLTQTFKYIKYYYPGARVPNFISFLSGFSYQIPIGEDYMGIGLDMFLGRESKFYPALIESIPRYQSRRFEPIYIVPRVAEEFARQELFLPIDEDRTLLSQMIYNGKILYFMDQVLSESVSDTVKIGYNSRQLAWCKNFEGNIWAVLLENDLLYKTDIHQIQKYLTDGPFTAGLGDKTESAPKLGIWIGWQIVKKYMEENPNTSLQELMADNDAQKILAKSKYKPKIREGT